MRGQLPGFVARRPMRTIEEWGDQHKYPELYDRAGKRLPHAKQVLYGKDIGGKGMLFEARLAIQTDGKVVADGDGPAGRGRQRGADVIGAGSSFNGYQRSPSRAGLDPFPAHHPGGADRGEDDFAALQKRHLDDHRALFDRVSLRMDGDPAKDKLPTDQRIAAFGVSGDPDLAALALPVRALSADRRLAARAPSPSTCRVSGTTRWCRPGPRPTQST